jgi:hypothetical protein
MARGNEQKRIFRDDHDREHFLELIAEMVVRFQVRVHCFVLMDGDSGRDMGLYLGRRLCGLKLVALAEAAGLRNYGVVATNVKRYQQRLETDRASKRE